MKFIGKYITYVGLFYIFSMMVYGWYIVFTNGNTTYGLTTFQLISGIIGFAVLVFSGIIIIACAILLLILFSIWSFKKDDRKFVEFVKGIF
ncbi:MAG: hypothetical protein RSC93_00325 [Erysipelotrichaceae bacterium]